MTDVAMAGSVATDLETAGEQWLADVVAASAEPPMARSADVVTTGDTSDDPAGRQDEIERRETVLARARALVATIDRLFGEQIDAVLHHPRFQRLEALWRGAAWLVSSFAGDAQVKLRILDVRWSELARDMERALTFDQSVLFQKVYNEEFGIAGGEPFGLLVTDHALWHRSTLRDKIDDIEVAAALSEVAAAAFCPIAMGVDPRIAGLDDFDEIDLRQDLAASLTGTEFARFERLRGRPDTRFLAAVLPRILIRQPYRGRALPRLGVVYDERVSDGSQLCWLSGSFALAEVAGRAMRTSRWPAAIRGVDAEGGGRVAAPERLALPSDRRGTVARFPTENAISEEQEMALNNAGFICLRQIHLTGDAVFLNVPTLHRPPEFDSEAARMNAKMSAMLNYILCVSRFAHYVKVMARDWIGKYSDAEECERLLSYWLSNYVTGNEDPSSELRAQYPLREARVMVNGIPGKPGSYTCEIAIRPHYQLDQIASEFRLTTAIGREANAA